MTKTILEILLSGANIFTEERRRYFSKKLIEHNDAVAVAKGARYPDYNDDVLAEAIRKRNDFLVAYQKEFEQSLKNVLERLQGANP